MQMDAKLRQKIAAIPPLVRIGKNGLTDGIIDEICRHLRLKDLVKVRMLPAYIAGRKAKDRAVEIAGKTESNIVSSVGFVLVLSRK